VAGEGWGGRWKPWKGGETGGDVDGPGKWSAPWPTLALGGPGWHCCELAVDQLSQQFPN